MRGMGSDDELVVGMHQCLLPFLVDAADSNVTAATFLWWFGIGPTKLDVVCGIGVWNGDVLRGDGLEHESIVCVRVCDGTEVFGGFGAVDLDRASQSAAPHERVAAVITSGNLWDSLG